MLAPTSRIPIPAVTIGNVARTRARRWTNVVLPLEADARLLVPDTAAPTDVAAQELRQAWFLFSSVDFLPSQEIAFLGYRGQRIGRHGVEWLILADLPGRQVLRCNEVAPAIGYDQPAVSNDLESAVRAGLAMSLWIDNIHLGTKEAGAAVEFFQPDAAGAWLSIRHELHGWRAVWFFRLNAGSPLVDFEVIAGWSDRTVPTLRTFVEGGITLSARSARAMVIYHGKARGFARAGTSEWHGQATPWVDGVGLRLTGCITLPVDADGYGHALDEATVAAAEEGPIVATCDWKGCALGAAGPVISRASLLDVPGMHGSTTASNRLDADLAEIGRMPQSYWNRRRFANNPKTGDAGTQECFGSQMGLSGLYDPFRKWIIDFSADDYWLRGYHHQERGDTLRAKDHPSWETFGLVTERNSQDFLGKDKTLQVWGWDAYGERSAPVDDQHRGDLYALFAYGASRSPSLRLDMLERIEGDLARAKQNRNQLDAPRASGRLWQSWANMLILLADDPVAVEKLRRISLKELDLILATVPPTGGWLQIVVSNNVIPGKPAAMPWHDALCLLGAWQQAIAWHRMGDIATAERFRVFCLAQAKWLLKWAMVRSPDGTIWPLTGVWVPTPPETLPADYYTYPRPLAGESPVPGNNMLVGSAGWHEWMVAIYAIARFLRAQFTAEEQPLLAIADQVADHLALASTENALEWASLLGIEQNHG